MVTEDFTLGVGTQCNNVSQNYTLKAYIILLTNVTPISSMGGEGKGNDQIGT